MSPATAQETLPVEVDVDYASFAYTDSTSLLEIYFGVNPTSLHFERDEDQHVARLPMNLRIVPAAQDGPTDTTLQPVWQDSLDLQFALKDMSTLRAGLHFVHQVRMDLRPGEYELHVGIAADSSAQRHQELEIRRGLMVSDYAQDQTPVLSDLQLAASISPDTEEGTTFYKHGLMVRPNVNRLYGSGLSQVFYLIESYHTGDLVENGGDYTVRAFVSPANGQEPIDDELEQTMVRQARTRDVILGSLDVSGLPTGSYFLRVALAKEDDQAAVEQAKKFFIYNPGVEERQGDPREDPLESSPFASMSEEDIERELRIIEFIASDQEQQRARQIETLEAQRRFLLNFWQKRDPQPRTAVNEAREEFLRRVEYVNTRYGSQISEGWETDRGRILLEYGDPVAVESSPVGGSSSFPYVIWEYENIPGEGRSVFVFADHEGFGVYDLLHSNVAGERKMPNWQEVIAGR